MSFSFWYFFLQFWPCWPMKLALKSVLLMLQWRFSLQQCHPISENWTQNSTVSLFILLLLNLGKFKTWYKVLLSLLRSQKVTYGIATNYVYPQTLLFSSVIWKQFYQLASEIVKASMAKKAVWRFKKKDWGNIYGGDRLSEKIGALSCFQIWFGGGIVIFGQVTCWSGEHGGGLGITLLSCPPSTFLDYGSGIELLAQ